MTHAQIRAFHAVAVHGGFSRAAERLGLTQPAVSDHVRKLEESYGIQLFKRGARSVELTVMGRKLFAVTERQFEAEAQAQELLSRARTLEEGQLTIGADAAVHVLPHIARYRAKYPRVALRMVAGNSADLLHRLEGFSIDLAVTAEKPSSAAILARLLRCDRLVAVTAVKSVLVPGGTITLARLAGLPLILREEGSVTRRLLLEEIGRRGLRVSAGLEIEGRESAREAAAQGLGIAVMSEGEFVTDARLRKLAISDWQASMEEWLLCLASRANLHVIRSFFAELPKPG